jgi:polar amino acid transport system permease protein
MDWLTYLPSLAQGALVTAWITLASIAIGAARALNFGRVHTLMRICLPQAIVEMMPAFGNLAIETLKLSSLVSLISIADLTFRAQSIRNITLDSATVYTLTLVGYFLMSLVLMLAMRLIERMVRRGAAFPRAAHA